MTINGSTNGVVSFSFAANPGLSRTAYINLLGQSIPVTQSAPNFALGTTARLDGPQAGEDSVVLSVTPQSRAWTATANADWLHLNTANESGTGSTNVLFSYDANAGATRSGTLTIAGLTLTVSQAGSSYIAANSVATLISSGLIAPKGVAVDGLGNVYIADSGNDSIEEWSATNSALTTLVSGLGLNDPSGVAVDGSGNVYIADTGDNRIKEWMPANSNLSVLVLFGFNQPEGVAVDDEGNVFIADTYNYAVEEWSAANGLVSTLVSSGLAYPVAVAVDGAGNVYIANAGSGEIDQWTAASSNVATLVSGLNYPDGVAVDGAGNVYIANRGGSEIDKWPATNGLVSTLVPGLSAGGMAVDGTGNLFFVNVDNNTVEELPYAFVDPTAKSESAVAGQDVLPVVLPATENLLGPLSPTSDQAWLTINGSTNGVVSFSFAANPGLSRMAHIDLLGQSIPVTQGAPAFSLGASARLEGPPAGRDSVVLAVIPQNGVWSATANDSWLHLNAANQSGTGSADVIFSYEANAGATRSGTLTVGGQTLTVTQAGSIYVAAGATTALVSLGLNSPLGLAVDGAGQVVRSRLFQQRSRDLDTRR